MPTVGNSGDQPVPTPAVIKSVGDVVEEHYKWASSTSARTPLGWSFFDQATGGGVALGEVCMMLAYSGVGKTWWGCNVVINNPTVPTIFFSLEMQGRALAQRLAAVAYGVTTASIEIEVLTTGRSVALEQLKVDFPLLGIDDTINHSLQGMKDSVDKAGDVWGQPPQMVIADYMELIKAGPALSSLEAVDRVSRSVKNFARSTDTSFIVLHQTNSNESARVSQDWGGGRGGSRVDAGHLPLTRKAARYGGDIAADYTVAVYKPSLDPNMSEAVRAYRENEIFQQLLKNRGGSVLHLSGVQHYVDIRNWRISEIQTGEIDDGTVRSGQGGSSGHVEVDFVAPAGRPGEVAPPDGGVPSGGHDQGQGPGPGVGASQG